MNEISIVIDRLGRDYNEVTYHLHDWLILSIFVPLHYS